MKLSDTYTPKQLELLTEFSKFEGYKILNVYQGGRVGEKDRFGFEDNMYALLYLKQITNKDLLYSIGNSAQCYVAAWMGVLGENGYMYMYG